MTRSSLPVCGSALAVVVCFALVSPIIGQSDGPRFEVASAHSVGPPSPKTARDIERATFDGLARQLDDCSTRARVRVIVSEHLHASPARDSDCVGAIYVWSPVMPLSERGIAEVREATLGLGMTLALVNASDVDGRVRDRGSSRLSPAAAAVEFEPATVLAAAIATAGGTAHYPALLVYSAGAIAGTAILGFKTAEGYRSLLTERMASVDRGLATRQGPPYASQLATAETRGQVVKDVVVDGAPSAYFRYIPNHGAVALTRAERVYIIELESGQSTVAPGHIDFIPSPDGRLFVTPSRNRGGLRFYSEDQIFGRQAKESSDNPIYVDPVMRDEYPSIGLLQSGERATPGNTTYRVLTSWFDRAVFRDYSVRLDAGSTPIVQASTESIIACSNLAISIPILSHSGRELAARDEATGTTKIFRLADNGMCTEVLDLKLSTGKVAWSPDGTHLAFSIAKAAVVNRVGAPASDSLLVSGVFVLRRSDGALTRVAGSEGLNQLVFPDFVGRDSIVFLMSARDRNAVSRLRIVCCF